MTLALKKRGKHPRGPADLIKAHDRGAHDDGLDKKQLEQLQKLMQTLGAEDERRAVALASYGGRRGGEGGILERLRGDGARGASWPRRSATARARGCRGRCGWCPPAVRRKFGGR